jgi:pyridoxal phosphate enzyme (YggS family)
VKARIEAIRQRIAQAAHRCGRRPETIRLVAVTKTVEASRIQEAVDAGARIVGENYIQEARDKHRTLQDVAVSWHFIGHLQANKAKYAVEFFDLIHSVDSLKLAQALNRQAAKLGKVQSVLIQVNVAGEASKFGVSPDGVGPLVAAIAPLSNVSVQGLMTMPPFFDQPERVRPFFAQLRQIAQQLENAHIPGLSMRELSMGMTGDFEVAVEEGATLVRIGTAIFGQRQ